MDENDKFREIAEGAFNPMEQAMGTEMVELIKREKAAYIEANIRMTQQHIELDRAKTRLRNTISTAISLGSFAAVGTWVAWIIDGGWK